MINLGPQDNEINRINDTIEMLDNKKTYYWLEKLNNMNFDIMCIDKIFDAEIEKSILELEDMGKKNNNNK